MESYDIIWQSVLESIKQSLPLQAFNLWFTETVLEELDGETAVISIPSDLKRNIIESKFSDIIKKSLSEVIGFSISLRIVSTENKKNHQYDNNRETEKKDNVDSVSAEQNEIDSKSDEDGFFGEYPGRLYSTMKNPEYQFENFIVGSSNKMAHAASLAVANNPCISDRSDKDNYNPLFIYGNSGLGKTHLLYAIMNRISEKYPDLVIVFVKGDEFTIELIDSLSKRTTQKFRDKYRKADVLLIDDIQFIAGKESIQEEFFNTFNALYEDKKQIILTADRPPRDMNRLEDRLKSRFEWGLMADIQMPDYELRTAIIKNKAKAMGIVIPNDVLSLLSEKLHSNIRQLEGVVRKIAAQNFISGTPIDKELASACISDILSDVEISVVTVDKIMRKVSKKYGISVEDIMSRKRSGEISNARHICIYLMSVMMNMTTTQIGNYFERNHTTVMSSLDVVKNKIDSNPLFKIEINDIIKDIQEA